MTRYLPGQPQNHNIWWCGDWDPHRILGLWTTGVYDLWTVCGGGVDSAPRLGEGWSAEPLQPDRGLDSPVVGLTEKKGANRAKIGLFRGRYSRVAGIGTRFVVLVVR